MESKDTLKFTNDVLVAPMLAVLAIWTVFWVEVKFHVNLNHFGVYPRALTGLRGIVLSPFIHGSLEHLYNNTIPLAVLTAFLFYFYRSVAVKVFILGVLISGLVTWVMARPSYHIGASGLIYVLASFIFFKGILAKNYRLVALSLIVVFIYGSMIWYIFPIEEEISWEGHLSGFLTGLLLAFTTKVKLPAVRKYAWEHEDYNEDEDPFLRHFDADGNFIENLDEAEEEIQIKYHYKESGNED
ncbi:rhomboid family intramembrane serine protease [Flagellimonas zhangzhouensis]|uniref:Membrane associated serine protease, rhomboid family n=1 Tax=Flagellimonas zhangzhouensis TaxID=1073328 RepID=A0A1H2Q4S6_9FLAO|nr:rhomboid family intramembrane serine protease [Allomuricauda zhangzhouensis]SDQ48412.1 Membrane associated serine protease, rhomboid family [Allomuricauda zhangzhouensis]SDW02177.1 Membrane associated serine protease, rhomboid family [Allomuricauda zhangzhouensis]